MHYKPFWTASSLSLFNSRRRTFNSSSIPTHSLSSHPTSASTSSMAGIITKRGANMFGVAGDTSSLSLASREVVALRAQVLSLVQRMKELELIETGGEPREFGWSDTLKSLPLPLFATVVVFFVLIIGVFYVHLCHTRLQNNILHKKVESLYQLCHSQLEQLNGSIVAAGNTLSHQSRTESNSPPPDSEPHRNDFGPLDDQNGLPDYATSVHGAKRSRNARLTASSPQDRPPLHPLNASDSVLISTPASSSPAATSPVAPVISAGHLVDVGRNDGNDSRAINLNAELTRSTGTGDMNSQSQRPGPDARTSSPIKDDADPHFQAGVISALSGVERSVRHVRHRVETSGFSLAPALAPKSSFGSVSSASSACSSSKDSKRRESKNGGRRRLLIENQQRKRRRRRSDTGSVSNASSANDIEMIGVTSGNGRKGGKRLMKETPTFQHDDGGIELVGEPDEIREGEREGEGEDVAANHESESDNLTRVPQPRKSRNRIDRSATSSPSPSPSPSRPQSPSKGASPTRHTPPVGNTIFTPRTSNNVVTNALVNSGIIGRSSSSPTGASAIPFTGNSSKLAAMKRSRGFTLPLSPGVSDELELGTRGSSVPKRRSSLGRFMIPGEA